VQKLEAVREEHGEPEEQEEEEEEEEGVAIECEDQVENR